MLLLQELISNSQRDCDNYRGEINRLEGICREKTDEFDRLTTTANERYQTREVSHTEVYLTSYQVSYKVRPYQKVSSDEALNLGGLCVRVTAFLIFTDAL